METNIEIRVHRLLKCVQNNKQKYCIYLLANILVFYHTLSPIVLKVNISRLNGAEMKYSIGSKPVFGVRLYEGV